jgi:hypothetical protein
MTGTGTLAKKAPWEHRKEAAEKPDVVVLPFALIVASTSASTRSINAVSCMYKKIYDRVKLTLHSAGLDIGAMMCC